MRKAKVAEQHRKNTKRVKVTAASRLINRQTKKKGPSALRRKAGRVWLQSKPIETEISDVADA